MPQTRYKSLCKDLIFFLEKSEPGKMAKARKLGKKYLEHGNYLVFSDL